MTSAQQQLLHSVQALQEAAPNPRFREIIQALVRHIHEFASETRLTREEWLAGLNFLNRVGQKSIADRDEFMLLSDVLGLSSLMDILHEQPGATAGTVLGPYYVPDSPERPNGASVIDTDDGGARLTVRGIVRSTDGKPLPHARVDVWSCASNGLYPLQDPTQASTNLRALITADEAGRYEFTTLRPTNYSVPTDGPVGELLRHTDRSSMRAAHVHLIVSAPGYETVTTHLFDSECKYLLSDSVFSVRDTLIRTFEKAGEHTWKATFDVELAPRPRA